VVGKAKLKVLVDSMPVEGPLLQEWYLLAMSSYSGRGNSAFWGLLF
jgi:hypothetical protein